MGSERSKKNEYERKRKRNNRTISCDDEITEHSINKHCKKASEAANMMKSHNNPIIYYSELAGKFVWDKKMTDDDLTESLIDEDRAQAKFQEWEKREKKYYFDQCKAGSEIRLREGRIRPIDILSMHLDEPYLAFESLSVKDLDELRKEIVMHLDLDRETPTRYWEELLVVCGWELAEARKKEDLEDDRLCREQPSEERSLNARVEAEVKNLLQGKSLGELEVIQSEIETQINIYKAKACLKEIHEKILRKNFKKDRRSLCGHEVDAGWNGQNDQTESEKAAPTGLSYSPELLHCESETEDAINPDGDNSIPQTKRVGAMEEHQRLLQEALASRRVKSDENDFIMTSMGDMEEGDSLFSSNDEVVIESHVYWWQDKYRPRKPKCFNRVQTENEWNIYNHTHYDYDNPPSKIVKGYKFSILYPDLIDTEAPTYTTEKNGDSVETCIIRFHAGPPYEDIAFRILNKEWECSAKKGFKCTFERGILNLTINFRQQPYRQIPG
ncbi:splicing factor Cactin-like [Apium graveolens]|uniref:splicing factor Cactin-like n=1 Tax=Apium graveolens TaxID=4045 RepID=UPI003D79F776